ncbi:MAG: hypothetical protein P8H96_04900 [Akkermansiaceae bacterium]|nr:hypothetical protein [Akkermansiaceae bacterium]
MILTDAAILEGLANGSIALEPFSFECLGSNSYDVHLGKSLATYRERVIDAKAHTEIEYSEIPEGGYVLEPELLYLGITQDYTKTHSAVPFLGGKSSVAGSAVVLSEVPIFQSGLCRRSGP